MNDKINDRAARIIDLCSYRASQGKAASRQEIMALAQGQSMEQVLESAAEPVCDCTCTQAERDFLDAFKKFSESQADSAHTLRDCTSYPAPTG